MSARQTVRSKWFCIVLLLALVGSLLAMTLATEAKGANAQSVSPDQPGPYHIGYYFASYYVSPYGWYTATIRYPALKDGWRAHPDMSGKPYAGIVVTDGYLSIGCMIDWIPEHLTSCGYVTLCFTTPNPALNDDAQWAYGFNGGISKLESENSSAGSPIRGLLGVSPGKFGIIGMSSGGEGVIQAAATNTKVGAAVALAPDVDPATAANVTVPIQLQVGSHDGLVQPSSVQDEYAAIPSTTDKAFAEINGGNHVGYLDKWAAKVAQALGVDNPCTIGFAAQHRVASKYFTAWFGYYLKGQQAYETYMDRQGVTDSPPLGTVLSVWNYAHHP